MIALTEYYNQPTSNSYWITSTYVSTGTGATNYEFSSYEDCCDKRLEPHELIPGLWHAPRCAGQVDPIKDKPNAPLRHNTVRSIAPIHFRSYRAQVCRGK